MYAQFCEANIGTFYSCLKLRVMTPSGRRKLLEHRISGLIRSSDSGGQTLVGAQRLSADHLPAFCVSLLKDCASKQVGL